MSPDTYRKLIKPHHKRLNDEIINLGMKPIFHCCGRAEDIIEDMIDCGYVAWTSVQPTNDIASLLKNYGDKISILGGYDTNGPPGMYDQPEELARAEVRRCIDEYGQYKGYVFFGVRVANSLDPAEIGKAVFPVVDESIRYALQKARQ